MNNKSDFITGVLVVVTLWLAFGIGYVAGRYMSYRDCDMLGGFYYGNKVFECRVTGG